MARLDERREFREQRRKHLRLHRKDDHVGLAHHVARAFEHRAAGLGHEAGERLLLDVRSDEPRRPGRRVRELQPATERAGHVARTDETDRRHVAAPRPAACERGPKIAVPIRSSVAPAAMAAS